MKTVEECKDPIILLKTWAKNVGYSTTDGDLAEIIKCMQLYTEQKWKEACEAQQRLIIDTILNKTEVTGNESQENLDTLRLFAKYWDRKLAPLPTFKA